MLTRTAVAKQLRRSLATVRRLEGVELFPQLDSRGVYRFDEREVARVARRLATGNVQAAVGQWLMDGKPDRVEPRRRLGASRNRANGTTKNSAWDQSDEIERLRAENAELKAMIADFCQELDDVTNR